MMTYCREVLGDDKEKANELAEKTHTWAAASADHAH
jgi:hypothetical protein